MKIRDPTYWSSMLHVTHDIGLYYPFQLILLPSIIKDRQGVFARVWDDCRFLLVLCQLYSKTFMKMIIYKLFSDIKQKEMHWEFTAINENNFFCKHFFNIDISAAITHNSSKLET